MRRHLANIALILAALAVCMLAGEAVVRTLQAYDRLPDYASKSQPQKQQANQTEQVNPHNPKLKKSGNPLLHVEYDTSDPRVNALGMRGPLPMQPKPAGTYRIAVLGDSVGFGFGLPREESFPYLLETLLQEHSTQQVEILNFSVIGYGLEAYIEVYRQRVRPLQPDLVLLSYVLNDMTPPANVFVVIKDVMKEQARLRRLARISQFAAWTLVTYREAMKGIEGDRSFTALYANPDTGVELARLLQILKSETLTDKAHLLAFVFPYFTELDHYPFSGVHNVVNTAMQQAGVPHHDLLENFRGKQAETLQLQPGDITHPNAEGNRIAAQAIADYLLQQHVLQISQYP